MGNMYYDTENGLKHVHVSYAVVRQTNTFSLRAGLRRKMGKKGRTIDVFVMYLHGSPYGYVDSRDVRSSIGAGIELGNIFRP